MPKDKNQDLLKLLEKHLTDEEFAWLSELDLSKVTFPDAVSNLEISIASLKETYSIRAGLNEEKGGLIRGFPFLLRSLEQTSTTVGLLNEMRDLRGVEYMIFSDPDFKELLGILTFPMQPDSNRPRGRSDG